MKLTKMTLAFMAVSTGMISMPTYAEKSEGFEFHGYFRAGVLLDANDDFKRSKFPGSKERLGRLGIESDNHFELALQKNFENEKGQQVRIKTRAGADNSQYATNQLGANADATNSEIGMVETYVEFDGYTETGTVWGGKRFYGKDNYIFMTDFFYTDMSGTGVGVEGIELGGNKWDFAYIASDDSGDTGFWGDGNNVMNAVHVGIDLGGVELHAMGKHLPDNIIEENGVSNEYATSGYDLSAIVHSESVYGLSEKGFTKYIGQVGKGLGSGQLLGGTLTTYNTYAPGSNVIANKITGTDCGTSCVKAVESGDISMRALVWGGYFFDNGVSVFHSLQGQYNDKENGSTDSWASAMVRPTFPISDNLDFITEVGYQYNHEKDASDTTSSSYDYKLTVGPKLKVDTGFGPIPEIRFLATYLDGDQRAESDILVGIQADMWW
ncbi:carbohydrate porin [Halomonas alkaliantarctica]|uniref:carbohydrate porin n=1 Tax=Halomonas alkaliantarctica TaxID=232346 RepID=UPI0004AA12BA|nr:carbohydrate porin [Halomonas alkaliantarctica]